MPDLSELANTGAGLDLAILGSGPSLSELDLPAICKIPTLHTLAVNTPDPHGVYDYWLMADHSQYRHNHIVKWTRSAHPPKDSLTRLHPGR
jgi:hypothetical protein